MDRREYIDARLVIPLTQLRDEIGAARLIALDAKSPTTARYFAAAYNEIVLARGWLRAAWREEGGR